MKKKTTPKTTTKRGPSRTFRGDASLDGKIQSACAATGANLSELAQIVFARYLDTVARELIAERAQAVEKFLSDGGGAIL